MKRIGDHSEEIRRRLTPLRASLAVDGVAALDARVRAAGVDPADPVALGEICCAFVRDEATALEMVVRRAEGLRAAYTAAHDERERRWVMRTHLFETVERGRARRRDQSALGRWLDLEALLDREMRRRSRRTQRILVGVELIESLAPSGPPPVPRADASRPVRPPLRPTVAECLAPLLNLSHTPRVQEAALACATKWALGRSGADPHAPAHGITRAAWQLFADSGMDRWVRIAAMHYLVRADRARARERMLRELAARPRHPRHRDHFLIRRHVLRTLARQLPSALDGLALRSCTTDPSEHVRQELARALAVLTGPSSLDALVRLLGGDASPRVRAVALEALDERREQDGAARAVFPGVLRDTLRGDQDPLVLGRAVELCERYLSSTIEESDGQPPDPPRVQVELQSALVQLCQQPASPRIAERSAHALRHVALANMPEAWELGQRIGATLESLPEGQTVTLRTPAAPVLFRRALVVANREGMAVSARAVPGGWQIRKGEKRRRRLWRLLHELRRPAPDKRQGYAHTVGRRAALPIRCPPVGMSEVTPTRVPGERRFCDRIQGWGPFLPRVDDLLDACSLGEPVSLVTSAGTVTVIPPASRWRRFQLRSLIAWGYARIAESRERSLDAAERSEQSRYLRLIRRLGFSVQFNRDEQIAGPRRAPVSVQLPWVDALLTQHTFAVPPFFYEASRYFFSDHGNTPSHLVVVVLGLFVALLSRAFIQQWEMRRALAAMPMTIGGWGTRGKSGTERLKAAIFHALGYDVLVKTTGCEAMFIHGVDSRPAHEIFLYRPYDKATIWEQLEVLRIAAGLRCQVLLWECMALRPRFVEILAHWWMRSKLATITNTYPDHEDVMGPSGEDVARVIAGFIPKGGDVVTTEHEMLPLLQDHARRVGARLESVPAHEADLIPEDLLSRFPYQEHPANIALTARMAQRLGVDPERAIVAMADHVVPDIGVLRTYPTVRYRDRLVLFSNGMSANERAGALANWSRLGLDQHTVENQPDVAIVTVVNNRGDRVPRSRVFARMMVRDMSAHRHVLIGTNLGGLRRYLEEELQDWLKTQWVVDERAAAAAGSDARLRRFDRLLARLKVLPPQAAAWTGALSRMLETWVPASAVQPWLAELEPDPLQLDARTLERSVQAFLTDQGVEVARSQACATHTRGLAEQTRAVAEMRQRVVQGEPTSALNESVRGLYRELFWQTIHVVEDSKASGDDVIDAAVATVPPGSRVHLVGLQNIKGTGLGFVYRWLSIERVHRLLERLGDEPGFRGEGLALLSALPSLGAVDGEVALQQLDELVEEDDPEWVDHRGALEQVRHRLRSAVDAQRQQAGQSSSSLWSTLLTAVEQWLDPLDAMLRRYRADRVMAELLHGRVGQQRAASLMREVTSRDKGGWLVKAWDRIRKRKSPTRSLPTANADAGVEVHS